MTHLSTLTIKFSMYIISFKRTKMLNWIVRIDVMSMHKITALLPSSFLPTTTTKVKMVITNRAMKSTRTLNQVATPP